MFWRKYWIFWWSISFKAFPIFFCALAKLDPLSLCRALKFPLLVINRCRACMNESVSMLHVRSVCTAMLAKHMKSAPYLLSSFLPSFIRNGSNMSMSQLLNGGQSNVLSFGRSAMFCSPSFPLRNWHLTHFRIRLLTIVLDRTTQKSLLLISFMTSLMYNFLVAPLYNQSGDVAIFAK